MIVAAVIIVPTPFVGEEQCEIEECVVRTDVDDDTGLAVLFSEWGLDSSLARRGAAGRPQGLRRQAPLVFGILADAPVKKATFAGRRFHGNFDGIGSAVGFNG